jgi:GNAT superfamily N-acetyltransferase
MSSFRIEPLTSAQRAWVIDLLDKHWGLSLVISRGRVLDVTLLPGFVAIVENQCVGLATYRFEADACELVTLNSECEGIGIGSALVTAVKEVAVAAGCHRLWLITTNDNLPALGFYQKRGFRMTAVYPDALDISRQRKPQIPFIGLDGIPLRDEFLYRTPKFVRVAQKDERQPQYLNHESSNT